MNIFAKMTQKANDNYHQEGVTIAFLGDSVTQGCFEVYKKENNAIETIFDRRHSYEQYFSDMLAHLFPSVTVNIINAGISGDSAPNGAKRVVRDVLRHEPDLVVMCYGLNDCKDTEDGIQPYVSALNNIFDQVMEQKCELIFMTPNMMCTTISPHLTDPDFIKIAENLCQKQNSGVFDAYIAAARELCAQKRIPVCDCYAIWKSLYQNGVNVTELLSNKVNHPTREMNYIFAYELIKTMLSMNDN